MLPFSEYTAWALIDFLLCLESDAGSGRICEAVRWDPAFSLWAICTAQARDAAELRTSAHVTDWLVRVGLRRHLRWTAAELDSQPWDDRSDWTDWSELAVASVQAVRVLSAEGASPSEEAELLALLHNARQWLATSMVAGQGEGDEVLACLPRWLSEHLQKRGGEPLASDTARRQPQASPGSRSDSPPGSPCRCEPSTEAVRNRWPMEEHPVACAVPRVLPCLVRLKDLESRFTEQLEHEKLLAMKELAYGAGHEINNPLANISSRAQTLLLHETDPEKRRKLATINSQAFRAHEMIADMMLFAHPPTLERERVNVVRLIDEVVDELGAAAQQQDTHVEHARAAPVVEIEADATQIKVAVRSLCTNSLEALGGGGHVRIEADCDVAHHGDPMVTIQVCDTGPGIPAETRRHLFDPFYSGREAGRGLGFGLSKAWRIVAAHGGHISVDSEPGAGARFTIHLPVKATGGE